MWLAMAMTFDDFYQGLPEEDEPPLTKTNETSVPEPNIVELNPLFKEADDPRLDEFRYLFSTPFACGFRRVVDIDQAGSMTKSYIAPDGITRLESLKAMEQFFSQHPTLDIPTLNFCWANLILGFDDPEWETICTPDPRQRYS